MDVHAIALEDGLEVLGAAVVQLERYFQCVLVVWLQAAISVPLSLGHDQVVVVGCGLCVQGCFCKRLQFWGGMLFHSTLLVGCL